MNLLVLAIIFLAGAIAAFVFFFSANPMTASSAKDSQAGFAGEVDSLKDELQKTKVGQWTVNSELESLKKRESALKEELSELREQSISQESEIKEIKGENIKLKDELAKAKPSGQEKDAQIEKAQGKKEDEGREIHDKSPDEQARPFQDAGGDWP